MMYPALVALLLSAFVSEGQAVAGTITQTWNGGFKGTACLDISKELHNWKAHMHFNPPIDKLETFAVDNHDAGGGDFVLTAKSWNLVEHPGDKLCVDFVARTASNVHPTITLTMEGMGGSGSGTGTGTGTGNHGNHNTPGPAATAAPVPQTGGGTARYNYGQALSKSILFYDAQRSGKLPANNPIPWRGNSAMGDKGDNGEDLTGGWYDAGDHVKFSLPMSSSSTVLLWGFLEWKDGYQAANQVNMFYDMIRSPLDYYMKCWNPTTQTLYAQVGNGDTDHAYWGRPEDMNMWRPAYKLTPSKPGADVAGEIAASLAAGYLAFKDKDSSYASKLLTASKQIYAFGKNHPGTYTNSIPDIKKFYGSGGYKDEMCEGAMWLYKATGDSKYLSDAKGFHEGGVAWALSWDDKKINCQMLLYEATKDNSYKSDIQGFLTSWYPGGSITYTPCGQAWRDQWGSNRYAGNSAFVALMAADKGIDSARARKWAEGQINYLLGDNNHGSYEIGFGSNFPRHPHHRGASFLSGSQMLQGALVGGPDQHDNYVDKQEDYVHNEVACDYNSGFQSALAGLTHLVHAKQLPKADPPKCHH